MTYAIEFTSAAARQLRKLEREAQHRVLQAIAGLSQNARPAHSRKLVGEALAWRIRTGDYRVIYEIHDEHLVVTIVRVAHRRDAYR